jgi:hypothetical protein
MRAAGGKVKASGKKLKSKEGGAQLKLAEEGKSVGNTAEPGNAAEASGPASGAASRPRPRSGLHRKARLGS